MLNEKLHFLNKVYINAVCKLAVAFLLLSTENFSAVEICSVFLLQVHTSSSLLRHHVHFQFSQNCSLILLQKTGQDQAGFAPESTSARSMT